MGYNHFSALHHLLDFLEREEVIDLPERITFFRIARTRTEDGRFTVENDELLDHPFKVLATGSIVKFRDSRSGEVYEKECVWCQDTVTLQTMFIPAELLEETE